MINPSQQPSEVEELRTIFNLIDNATDTYVRPNEKFMGSMHKYGIVDREKLTKLFNQHLATEVEKVLDRLEAEAVENVNGVKVVGLRYVHQERNKLKGEGK